MNFLVSDVKTKGKKKRKIANFLAIPDLLIIQFHEVMTLALLVLMNLITTTIISYGF